MNELTRTNSEALRAKATDLGKADSRLDGADRLREVEKADKALDKRAMRLEHTDRQVSPLAGEGIGDPASAQRYLNLQYKYLQLSRKYERQANDLKDRIYSKKEPQSRMADVRKFEALSKNAKSEAEKYKQYAQMELSH